MRGKANETLEAYGRERRAQLLTDIARAQADLARMTAELDKLEHALSGGASTPFALASVPRISNEQTASDGPYEGLTMTDAAVEVLKGQKKPVSVGMICAVLDNAGFKFSTMHPTRALGDALKKRMQRYADIFSLSHGLWGYRDNFTAAQITKLSKKHNGTGGKSLDDHRVATQAGVDRARAAGKRVGATPKFTEEKAIEFLKALDNDMSIMDACAHVGITRPTFYHYKRLGLLKWRPGVDPWPPQQSEQVPNDGQPQLRVVK